MDDQQFEDVYSLTTKENKRSLKHQNIFYH
jgi:hypothetical protein